MAVPERSDLGRGIGTTKSQFIWRKHLDPIADILFDAEAMAKLSPEEQAELRGAARAYAVCINMLTDSEPLAKTIQRARTRWEIRKGLRPWEMTPGYGYCKEDNDDPTEQGRFGHYAPGADSQKAREVLGLVKPSAGKGEITESVRTKVANALKIGMPVDALTQAYKLTKAQVESCRIPA